MRLTLLQDFQHTPWTYMIKHRKAFILLISYLNSFLYEFRQKLGQAVSICLSVSVSFF